MNDRIRPECVEIRITALWPSGTGRILAMGPTRRWSMITGSSLARSLFTVTTLGEAFITGIRGECTIDDFPSPGESALFAWNQATQGLVLVPEPFEFPLRALHAGVRLALNRWVTDVWEDAGRTGPLIPPDYLTWLNSMHVNWIGLSVAPALRRQHG